MVSIHQSIHQLGYDPALSYVPGIRQNLSSLHVEEGGFNDLERALEENDLDVSPVTDNSPFFYKFKKGIPQSVSRVFWSTIIMILLVILGPLLYWKKRSSQRETYSKSERGFNKNPLKFVVLFLMLGVGFMLAEISLMQRLVLFLGQPVLSLAVLLFSLLLGAGIGSIYSGRFASEKIIKVIAMASISIVAMLLSYTFLLPLIFNQLLGLDIAIRLLATVVILTPLGFLMGFPFPLGLRLLREIKMENYIPWMWGINGISSVLGSAMAVVIAISLGLTEALLIAAGCYFVVFLTFQGIQHKRSPARKEVQSLKGKIKRLIRERGFGFITAED